MFLKKKTEHVRFAALLFYLTGFFVFFQTNLTPAEDESHVQRANRLLQEACFQEALGAFQLGLRDDMNNPDLNKEIKRLRLIIQTRDDIRNEKNRLRQMLLAERLRIYYREKKIHSELLKLVTAIYVRTRKPVHATHVVQALIDQQRFQEALDFLNSLEETATTPLLQIEKASIFLKAGHEEKARTIVRTVSADSIESPDHLLKLSRLQAATHLHATAIKTLSRCFKLMPAAILPKVKEEVVTFPEFADLLYSSEFTEVMAIRPAVPVTDSACARKWDGMRDDEYPRFDGVITLDDLDLTDWRIQPSSF